MLMQRGREDIECEEEDTFEEEDTCVDAERERGD
jgi:hypothetical protein